METVQTKIYQKNQDCGDLGIPEVYPVKEIRGKKYFLISFAWFSGYPIRIFNLRQKC